MKAFLPPDINQLPGHLVRRLHQISQGLFHQELVDSHTTPVQFGVLNTIAHAPHIDQQTLANAVALDTSTTAGVVDRLEAKGLVKRSPSSQDKRMKLLTLTPEGHRHLETLVDGMMRSQALLLEPLTPTQRTTFMRLLKTLVQANNEYSRAPTSPRKRGK